MRRLPSGQILGHGKRKHIYHLVQTLPCRQVHRRDGSIRLPRVRCECLVSSRGEWMRMHAWLRSEQRGQSNFYSVLGIIFDTECCRRWNQQRSKSYRETSWGLSGMCSRQDVKAEGHCDIKSTRCMADFLFNSSLLFRIHAQLFTSLVRTDGQGWRMDGH